uniref:Chitin-binding type-2 domain-containing protein n=1 Tax=Elaeophora elaphi TaxID=1147741 RepID=A0A0R3RYE3_9BILA
MRTRKVNLQRPMLLFMLIVVTCRDVICTEVERMQHPEFLDGTYGRVREQWIRKHQRHRPTVIDQLDIKKQEVDFVPRLVVTNPFLGIITEWPSTKQASKLMRPANIPHEVPDDIGRYSLEVDDISKIWNAGNIRQQSFQPNQKRYMLSDIPSQKMQIYAQWDVPRRQHDGERKNIVALSERGEKYPLKKREKIDPLKCVGQKDGLYEVGPCEQWYLSCRNGKAKRIICTNGLYWNGDKGQCEPKSNIFYCRCKCDRKEMIPACGGNGQDQMKFINSQEKISRKSRREWREYNMLKLHQKRDICEKRKNGKYAIGKCYGRFLLCVDGKSFVVKCGSGRLYSSEYQQCRDVRNLPLCRDFTDLEATTVTGYSVSCASLPDGIYEVGDCERNFSICRNGVASNASCGVGRVYNGQTGHCDYEFNVEKCPKFKVEPEADEQIDQTGMGGKMAGSYRKQNVCRRWENGMYAIAKCYGKYLFCIDGRGLVVVCSHGQLFSPEHQQCMDAEKLPFCADLANPATNTMAGSPVQCSSLSDGVYELGSCERNFLICFNGEGNIASCDPDFIYNGQTGHCDYKFKVEKCFKYGKSIQRRDKSVLLPENADCRCKGQKNGLYGVGCSEKFYSCSNGISTGHECPKNLFFNVDSGFCDYPQNIAACGGYQPIINEIGVDEEGIASSLVSGCSILEDGIYGLAPCGSGYYHCLRGATSFAKCALDLVFNPSLNRCDFRENVPGCAGYSETSNKVKKPIHDLTIKPAEGYTSKCENLSDGFYVEGCSRIYYGCANGKIFYMNCPWNLAFDYRSGTCDEPNNVEACRSTSSGEMSSLFDGTTQLMPSCTTLSNGAYQFGPCLADYILCRDGITNLASCPDSLVFNPDNSQCALQSNVVTCGKANQSMKIQACIQDESSIDPLPQRPSGNLTGINDAVVNDDKFCDGLPNANYATGLCSRIFFSCVHMRKVLMSCPETLVFDVSTNRCEEPKNVAECQNDSVSDGQDVANQLVASTVPPLCVGRKDNVYPLDSCLRNYLQCYNQKGIVRHCPDNMVFDGTLFACVPKAACNQVTKSQYVTPGNLGIDDAENKLNEATKYSLPRCHELADGDYSAGCVANYTTCIGGSEIHKRCSDSTVFSNVLRRCVSYDQCAYLMYRILASFYPSQRLVTPHKEWVQQGNSVITPSVSVPELPPPGFSNSSADTEHCKYQVQCLYTLDGNAINMPDLASDGDVNRCEYVKQQCANEAIDNGKTGEIRDEEQSKTIESKPEGEKEESGNLFCVPEVPERQIDAIRCDNLEDGLYTLDCSDKVAVCSSGWKKVYECPHGLFFIPSLVKCDESWKCTETNSCGPGFVGVVYFGKIESITPLTLSLSTGGYSCSNKEDGNYGRQCSPLYIKCIRQVPILMRCQIGRLFDQRSSRCVPSDRCPMLSNTLNIGKARCVENERFGIDKCNDYYYSCSNGKFILYKCPPGHIFDIVHGACGPKCQLCGCQADDWTSTSACNPGELVSIGPCENRFFECNAQRTFEMRHCMNGKYFDPVLLICRFQHEIVECFGSSTFVPALYPVHDSFKHPFKSNPSLTRNEHDRNQYRAYELWELLINFTCLIISGRIILRLHDLPFRTKSVIDDFVSGSGEGDNASAVTDGSSRVKREISFDKESSETEVELEADSDTEFEDGYFESGSNPCPSATHPVNVTLGDCHPSYIFCSGKEDFAYVVDCNDGELFDSGLKECVPATDCTLRTLYHKSNVNGKTPCALLSDGTYALAGCSKYFLSCVSNKAILRNCASGLYYDGSKQQCDYKERVASCSDESITYDAKDHSNLENVKEETKIAVANHEVLFALPNFTCSINSTISLGCSPSFVICAGDDLPHTLVNLTKVSYDVSSFDCVNAPDGLYASRCSPLFFVCSASHITGFVCQDELFFNLETGFCDQKEYVTSCEETDLIKLPTASSSITEKVSLESKFITAQPSYHSPLKEWKCEEGFNGIMSRGCSRKFILCVHGEGHLVFCQQGLVYNVDNNRCDYVRNVAACGSKTGIPFKKRAHNLRTVDFSNYTMQARCNASRNQAVAYGRCREDYISCLGSGTFRKSYCTDGYLFDEDVGRCVPAGVCGIVDDAVAESVSLAKGKCIDIQDGISKGIGPCLNEYYVCKKGVPIRRRCFKHLETFSATAGACVARSLNPECFRRSTILTDGVREINDTDDFCMHRPDGLYRHPTDCARILQCFGEEIFEHPPCDNGLVFNEISGGCDYKSNVPQCATTPEKFEKDYNPSLADGSNCEGKSHGDHLADEKDCSVFYRCVWGKLEKLFCPQNTVFNPTLSVCDFPSAVPYCKITM